VLQRMTDHKETVDKFELAYKEYVIKKASFLDDEYDKLDRQAFLDALNMSMSGEVHAKKQAEVVLGLHRMLDARFQLFFVTWLAHILQYGREGGHELLATHFEADVAVYKRALTSEGLKGWTALGIEDLQRYAHPGEEDRKKAKELKDLLFQPKAQVQDRVQAAEGLSEIDKHAVAWVAKDLVDLLKSFTVDLLESKRDRNWKSLQPYSERNIYLKVVHALGKIGSPAADASVPALYELLNQVDDVSFKNEVLETLGNVGKIAAPGPGVIESVKALAQGPLTSKAARVAFKNMGGCLCDGTRDVQLTNIREERFSIFTTGKVEFIRVPKMATTEIHFTVHATIESVGKVTDKCKEALYITGLTLAGSWLEGKTLEVSGRTQEGLQPMEVRLGGLQMMPQDTSTVIGVTQSGDKIRLRFFTDNHFTLSIGGAVVGVTASPLDLVDAYFLDLQANTFSKILDDIEDIGGLLGDDENTTLSSKPEGCERVMQVKADGDHSSARVSWT